LKHLKKLRTMVGRGQFWLADATGIERSRISLLENCHVQPTADEKAAIDKALIAAMRENLAEFRKLSGTEVRAAA
jgi:predicted transcriptional regulator